MRLIDADALADKFKTIYMDVENVAISHRVITSVDLMLAPTIDAEPVRHGRWIDEIEPNAVTASGRQVHVFRCSACDFTWANKTAVLHYFNHCPNCGAKMDLEAKE